MLLQNRVQNASCAVLKKMENVLCTITRWANNLISSLGALIVETELIENTDLDGVINKNVQIG